LWIIPGGSSGKKKNTLKKILRGRGGGKPNFILKGKMNARKKLNQTVVKHSRKLPIIESTSKEDEKQLLHTELPRRRTKKEQPKRTQGLTSLLGGKESRKMEKIKPRNLTKLKGNQFGFSSQGLKGSPVIVGMF